MNNVSRKQIARILQEEGAPSELQVRILNRLELPKNESAWHHVTAPLDAAIKTMRASQPKWRPTRRDTYHAYLQLMEKTRAVLAHAAREHETPAVAQHAALVNNANREVEGKRPMGECKSHWSTWIPPHIREATIAAFDALYSSPEEQALPPGRRVHPFTTLTQRGEISRKWGALLQQVQTHINAGPEMHPAHVEAQTRGMIDDRATEMAANLKAVHAMRYQYAGVARKTILARKRNHTDAGNLVIPIHWTHVLNDDAKARLRAAEKAVGGDGYTRDVYALRATVAAEDADGHGYIEPREDDLAAIAARAAAEADLEDARNMAARESESADWAARVDNGEL